MRRANRGRREEGLNGEPESIGDLVVRWLQQNRKRRNGVESAEGDGERLNGVVQAQMVVIEHLENELSEKRQRIDMLEQQLERARRWQPAAASSAPAPVPPAAVSRRSTAAAPQQSCARETTTATATVPTPQFRIRECGECGPQRLLRRTAGAAPSESLDDETFAKRHARHEKHERMIVRRDKMRQRELLLKERLEAAARRSLLRVDDNQHSGGDDTVGDLTQLSEIMVCKKLPKQVRVASIATPCELEI